MAAKKQMIKTVNKITRKNIFLLHRRLAISGQKLPMSNQPYIELVCLGMRQSFQTSGFQGQFPWFGAEKLYALYILFFLWNQPLNNAIESSTELWTMIYLITDRKNFADKTRVILTCFSISLSYIRIPPKKTWFIHLIRKVSFFLWMFHNVLASRALFHHFKSHSTISFWCTNQTIKWMVICPHEFLTQQVHFVNNTEINENRKLEALYPLNDSYELKFACIWQSVSWPCFNALWNTVYKTL